VTSGGTKERLKLVCGPGLLFDFGNRPQARRRRDERDVAVQEASVDSVVECSSDDEVHVVDSLGCSCSAAVAWLEHVAIDLLEVVWPKTPDPDPAQGREDVELGLRR
jgi:hypothetical protein